MRKLTLVLCFLLFSGLMIGTAGAQTFPEGTYALESLYLSPGYLSLIPDTSASIPVLSLSENHFILSGSRADVVCEDVEIFSESLSGGASLTFTGSTEDLPLLPYESRVFFSGSNGALDDYVLYRYQDVFYLFVQPLSGEDGGEIIVEILELIPVP